MNAPGGFGMSDGDVEALRRAKDTLEHAGLAARIAALLGMPIEEAMKRLPSKWSGRINRATESSLMAALKTALVTVEDRQRPAPSGASSACPRWPSSSPYRPW